MPPVRAKRILVVDDESSITLGIQMNLEALGGYKVRTENEGRKALKAARVFRPDLILLDIMMPDADGAEVASRLAEDPELRDIPVVFLTAIVAKRETGQSPPNMHRAKPKHSIAWVT